MRKFVFEKFAIFLRFRQFLKALPKVFLASFMSLKPRALFQVAEEDRKPVEVKFSGAAGA